MALLNRPTSRFARRLLATFAVLSLTAASTPAFALRAELEGKEGQIADQLRAPAAAGTEEEALQRLTFEQFDDEPNIGTVSIDSAARAQVLDGATTVLTIPALKPPSGISRSVIAIYVDNAEQRDALLNMLKQPRVGWVKYLPGVVKFDVRVYPQRFSKTIGETPIGFRPMGREAYPEMPTMLYHRLRDLMDNTNSALIYAIAMNTALQGQAIPFVSFTPYAFGASGAPTRYAIFARYA